MDIGFEFRNWTAKGIPTGQWPIIQAQGYDWKASNKLGNTNIIAINYFWIDPNLI